jgi:hypothetical protein
MGIWVALGLASFLFFHFNRNAALKRIAFPMFIVTVGVLFGTFVYLSTGRQHPQMMYLAVPAIVLISFLNIRQTRFCEACGKTLYQGFLNRGQATFLDSPNK